MNQNLRFFRTSFIAFLFGLMVLPVAAQQNINPGQLIVQMQYKKDVQQLLRDANEHHPNASFEINQNLSQRLNIWLINYDDDQITDLAALDEINLHKDVALAQFNHTNVTLRDTVCPNDTRFNEQWCHYNDGINGSGGSADMSSCDGWAMFTGGMTQTSEQIVVAVIDGGYDLNHEDLNFWTNTAETPGDNVDNDNNGYVDDINGWDAVANNGDVMFNGGFDSHGSHVAGIVGAIGNNNTGISGVSWGVEIMAITGSSGNEATVVAAYSYALEQRALYNSTNGASGAFVVSTNSSFGVDNADPANYPIWCAMYDSLGAYGIISAGATTNSNTNVDQAGDVPTACSSDYMVSVTNTNAQDNRNGSGYGLTTIDMGAPGTDILSTTPNDSYQNMTGTSMATPQVAGAIALMWSAACPGMIADYHNDPAGLALIMRNYLLNNSLDPAPDLNGETVTGGRLNLEKAIIATSNYAGCPPLGIYQPEQNFGFNVFPNPNEGRFNVNITSSAYGMFTLEVTDILGKAVNTSTVKLNGTEGQQVSFDLGEVNPGIYFVRMTDGASISKTVKILVK